VCVFSSFDLNYRSRTIFTTFRLPLSCFYVFDNNPDPVFKFCFFLFFSSNNCLQTASSIFIPKSERKKGKCCTTELVRLRSDPLDLWLTNDSSRYRKIPNYDLWDVNSFSIYMCCAHMLKLATKGHFTPSSTNRAILPATSHLLHFLVLVVLWPPHKIIKLQRPATGLLTAPSHSVFC
jgi:hypothetical protein